MQLVHEGMLTARKHCNAHAAYSKFRSAREILETFGLMDPAAEEGGAYGQNQRSFVAEMNRDYEQGLIDYRRTTGLSPLLTTAAASDTDLLTDNTIPIGLGVHDDEELKTHVRKLEMELQAQKKMNVRQSEDIVRLNEENARQSEDIVRLNEENARQREDISKIQLSLVELTKHINSE